MSSDYTGGTPRVCSRRHPDDRHPGATLAEGPGSLAGPQEPIPPREESAYLGIPCLMDRPNTERPITVTVGTNRLVQSTRDAIVTAARAALNGDRTAGFIPELWDGLAATRIAQVLAQTDNR